MYVFVCVNVFMCVVFVCILCFCMVCMLECVFVCLYVFHSINSRTRHLQIAVQASTDIISHTICRFEGEGGMTLKQYENNYPNKSSNVISLP